MESYRCRFVYVVIVLEYKCAAENTFVLTVYETVVGNRKLRVGFAVDAAYVIYLYCELLGYNGEYSRAGKRENEVVGFVLGKFCRYFIAAVDDLCGLFGAIAIKLCGGSERRKLFFCDEVAVAFKLKFRSRTVNLGNVLRLYCDIRTANLKLARAVYNVVAALGVGYRNFCRPGVSVVPKAYRVFGVGNNVLAVPDGNVGRFDVLSVVDVLAAGRYACRDFFLGYRKLNLRSPLKLPVPMTFSLYVPAFVARLFSTL